MEILSAALVGVMAGSLLLWRLPTKACDQCEHCLGERLLAESKKKVEMHRRMHAWYGGDRCPLCSTDS
jgi:hypothetical protein